MFKVLDDIVPFMEKVFEVKKTCHHKIPAVTHIDGTGRLQTVSKKSNPLYYDLINEFQDRMQRIVYENNIIFDNGMFGTWSDKQVPNTYAHYADPVMETLMMKVLPIMQQETGLQLLPTYSYARIYKKGDILKRHKDRPSCEISTTVHLGGDKWSIFIDGTEWKS